MALTAAPALPAQEPWQQAQQQEGAEQERDVLEAAAAAAAATAAAGHSNGWFTHRDLCSMPDLQVAAGCSTGGQFHRLLPGRLGLHSSSIEGGNTEQAAAAATTPGSGGGSGSTLARQLPSYALALSSDGALAQLAAVPTRACPLYTSPSPRDRTRTRMPSPA